MENATRASEGKREETNEIPQSAPALLTLIAMGSAQPPRRSKNLQMEARQVHPGRSRLLVLNGLY